MSENPRKTGLKEGLRQLTQEQLQRVVNFPEEMVLDTFNYFEGKFCPLAVGAGLDLTTSNPTHQIIQDRLLDLGYKIFNTRGIEGNFYTSNRKEDLMLAAIEVIKEKQLKDWLSQLTTSQLNKVYKYPGDIPLEWIEAEIFDKCRNEQETRHCEGCLYEWEFGISQDIPEFSTFCCLCGMNFEKHNFFQEPPIEEHTECEVTGCPCDKVDA